MLAHNDLMNYYKVIFALAQHHKYQISEIENLLPFERDFYMDLLLDYIKQVEEERRR